MSLRRRRKPVSLLSQVKNRLNVTWGYDDYEIQNMIEEGKAYLESRCGSLSFSEINPTTVDRLAVKILKEYCRYAWNGSAAYFEADYRSDILNLQLEVALSAKE